MGIIDDFDNDLTPRLVTILADSLTKCRLKLITAASHEITSAMAEKRLHIGVAASNGEMLDGVTEYPLVRDPFILVAPRKAVSQLGTPEAVIDTLPLLRYEREQLISRQIEAHLARQKLNFDERFEIGSHLSLMALVARGTGWAVTTPLGYMRAGRFHEDVQALPLPFIPFSRTISLFSGSDWADRVPRDVAQTVRGLVQTQVIEPAIQTLPWLEGNLQILEG